MILVQAETAERGLKAIVAAAAAVVTLWCLPRLQLIMHLVLAAAGAVQLVRSRIQERNGNRYAVRSTPVTAVPPMERDTLFSALPIPPCVICATSALEITPLLSVTRRAHNRKVAARAKVERAKAVAKGRRSGETHVSRCLGRVPVRPLLSQICRCYPCLREHLAIGLERRLHGTPAPARIRT